LNDAMNEIGPLRMTSSDVFRHGADLRSYATRATPTAGRRTRSAAHGFTLVELMVSVLIGFVVVGALLAAYMASYRTNTHNDALSQVTEDATLALSVMRSQVAMAGYSTPYSVDHAAQKMVPHTFWPVYGCAQSNFATPFTGILNALPCTGTSTSDTLEVAYEAGDITFGGGSSNAVLNDAGQPLDCLGNVFAKQAAEGGYYLDDSKFYVAAGSLYCQGPGSENGAPLVDNVDRLSVKYGFLGSHDALGNPQLGGYMPAPPAPPAPHDDWSKVMAVTICVQVHSTQAAFESNAGGLGPLTNYIDCDGHPQQSPDGRLRRSFSTTVLLQNTLP
jgi:type IV pilus assembly protein PilW